MVTTEELGRYPGIATVPQAAQSRENWGLKLLPADRHSRLLRHDKELLWGLGTGIILALSYLRPWYVKLPGGTTQLCLFRRLTGIPCLLCGMTRSLAAAARMQIGESFYLHLLGPFLFFFLALVFLGSLILLATGKRLELSIPREARNQLSWFLLVLLGAAWALKLAAFGANV